MSKEDQLDRQLRDAVPYIDDDGFTARVLQRLPAPRRAPRPLHAAILLPAAIIASLLVYFLSDGGRFLVVAMARLATLPTLWLLALALGSGILVMAGGLVAALSKAGELRS